MEAAKSKSGSLQSFWKRQIISTTFWMTPKWKIMNTTG